MKTCPNCGAQLALEAKFCTNCGTKLVDSVMEEKVVNSEVNADKVTEPAKETKVNDEPKVEASIDKEQLKQASLNYWSWLVSAFKHPFSVKPGSKWNGLVTLALEGLVFGLSVLFIFRNIYASTTSLFSQAFGVGSTGENPIGLGTLLTFFLVTFLTSLAVSGIVYGNVKLFASTDETFGEFINATAHRTAPILIMNVIGLLLSLTVSVTPTGVLMASLALLFCTVSLCIWNLGSIVPIYQMKNSRLDRLYVLLIVCFLNGIVYLIAYMAISVHYVSYFEHLLGGI